ncbi:MAG: phosphodiester glycosidase family protein [Bdellovibrionales bacterium]|nr:phosphodiester glycosidase family protein [Bdellovibrionales bacterium]
MKIVRLIALGCSSVLAILILASHSNAQASNQHSWQNVAEDLELIEFDLPTSNLFPSKLTAVRTHRKRYRVSVLRATSFGLKSADARSLCERSKAIFCLNANFFDERGLPLGLVVSRSIQHNGIHRGGSTLTGIFQVDSSGPSIIPRSAYSSGSAFEAVQAGPRLIVDGDRVKIKETAVSRRSGVCVDSQNRLIFYLANSSLGGISFAELQSVLMVPPLNCVDALNLDGGGSAQMYLSSKAPGASASLQEILITGRDKVPVMLGLVQK